MGRPMALHLMGGGHAMAVFARRAESTRPLADAGAAVCPTPAAVAGRSEVVFTMVTGTRDVEQVLLGPEGVVHGARPGSLVVDMSTIDPTATRDIAARLGERGVDMLDSPVSGGPQGRARRGADHDGGRAGGRGGPRDAPVRPPGSQGDPRRGVRHRPDHQGVPPARAAGQRAGRGRGARPRRPLRARRRARAPGDDGGHGLEPRARRVRRAHGVARPSARASSRGCTTRTSTSPSASPTTAAPPCPPRP